jgi:hypothetical protein
MAAADDNHCIDNDDLEELIEELVEEQDLRPLPIRGCRIKRPGLIGLSYLAGYEFQAVEADGDLLMRQCSFNGCPLKSCKVLAYIGPSKQGRPGYHKYLVRCCRCYLIVVYARNRVVATK